ncbi:MAG: hypothetical protein ACPG45_11340 [Flavobacteriaceae bacterium]
MKSIFTYLFLFTCTLFFAQEVTHNGNTYSIKGKKIYQNNEDVTSLLTTTDKEAVFSAHKIELEKIKEAKNAEKALEKKEKEAIKAEKEAAKRIKEQEKKLKAIEKKQKKVEKAAKKKANAEKAFDRAQSKLDRETKKFEKLKRRGKLSPVKEAKYLEKLSDLKDRVSKAGKKLKKL